MVAQFIIEMWLCTCNGDGHERVDVQHPARQRGGGLHHDVRQLHRDRRQRDPLRVLQPLHACVIRSRRIWSWG